MNDQIKMGLIIAAAILGATALWIYFSPYQTCVRSWKAQGGQNAETHCAYLTGGR
jgi:hypothetical protein